MLISYKDAGFIMHKELIGHGRIGVMKMLFTTALCCNISNKDNHLPYFYRYCYKNFMDCVHDFNRWDGDGHPKGNWIKRKSPIMEDFRNPIERHIRG